MVESQKADGEDKTSVTTSKSPLGSILHLSFSFSEACCCSLARYNTYYNNQKSVHQTEFFTIPAPTFPWSAHQPTELYSITAFRGQRWRGGRERPWQPQAGCERPCRERRSHRHPNRSRRPWCRPWCRPWTQSWSRSQCWNRGLVKVENQ